MTTRRRTRLHPAIVVHESAAAQEVRQWLERFLAPLTYEGAVRVDGRIDVFALAGTLGCGLLVESWSQVDGRPGVHRVRTSAWVAHFVGEEALLLEAELHSWDAGTEAMITGDRHWLEVPRRRRNAERDRRTAEIAAELDTFTLTPLPPGTVPAMLAGLSADRVRALARAHQPALLGERRGPPPPARPVGWPGFERRLAKAIGAMKAGTFLILTTPAERGAPVYYVQFARATSELRAEAVTSANLPPSSPLRADQVERIRALGWTQPGPGEPPGNAFRTWAMPAPAAEVAGLAVETLRSVYGIDAPAELRYRSAAFEGPDPTPPALGIEADLLRPSSRPRSRARIGARPPQQLRAEVERALAAWLGVPRVLPDPDGDYPIRSGSAMCYVRLLGGVPPAVAVFSPILADVRVTPELRAAIDDINARIRYGRVFTSGRAVVVSLELPAINLAPEHIAFACAELGALADNLDDVLHGRFGGHVAFDTSPKLVN
ncbi:MAG: YbjN protein [Chloroflexi bacterium]|nr:YbjN protein [Chloroflexota bacterium]